MKGNNGIKTTLRQSVWLLMACLCIVFSGAMKKILQLRADQKISAITGICNDGARSVTQNIKDGHREKHEIPVVTFSQNKQSPVPGTDNYASVSLFNPSIVEFNTRVWVSSYTSYKSSRSNTPGSTPLYLFSHKLLV